MTASWVLSDYRGITSILHRFFKEFFLYYSSSYIRLGVLNYLLPWFEASIRWDEMFSNYFKILPRTLNFPVLISYSEALHGMVIFLNGNLIKSMLSFVTERYVSIDSKMKGSPLSLEEMILMTIYSWSDHHLWWSESSWRRPEF